MPSLMLVRDSRYPPTWETIPTELLEALAPTGEKFITTRQRAAINRIAASRWFLVYNRGIWDIRCDGCNVIHMYLTIRCSEAPFNGLRQFYLFLDSHQDGDQMLGRLRELSAQGTDFKMIRDMSAADAAIYNQRIRDRDGVPVIDQRPLRADEINEDAMRERIVRNARRIRAAAQAMNVKGGAD